MWGIWNQRNAIVWRGKSPHAAGVILASANTLVQWQYANVTITSQPSAVPVTTRRWTKPGIGWSKCNVDASCFMNPRRSGFGGVIRDHEGVFVAAVQGCTMGHHQPFLAEAIALREVLSWLKRRNQHFVEIESDSQLLCLALKGNKLDYSMEGLVVSDCKLLLNDLAPSRVQFVHRSANAVAHSLARASSSLSGIQEWEMSPPQFISDVLIIDMI